MFRPVNYRRVAEVISFDFIKAFDAVLDNIFVFKLWCKTDWTISLREWCNKSYSYCKPVMSGIPVGVILGSVLFDIFVDDLEEVMECMLAVDIKLGWALGWYSWGQGCHLETSRQAWGMVQKEPYENCQGQMRSPVPWKEESLITWQTKDCQAREQLC